MWTIITKINEENIERRQECLEYDRKWIEGIRKEKLQSFPTYILIEGDKSEAIDLFEQYFGFKPQPDLYEIADFSEGTTWQIRDRESNSESLAHATGHIRGCSYIYHEMARGTTFFDTMDSLNEFLKRKDVLILTPCEID